MLKLWVFNSIIVFETTILCCRDDIFLLANPEVSIGLVPLTKGHCDFSIRFWITAGLRYDIVMILTCFVQQNNLILKA